MKSNYLRVMVILLSITYTQYIYGSSISDCVKESIIKSKAIYFYSEQFVCQNLARIQVSSKYKKMNTAVKDLLNSPIVADQKILNAYANLCASSMGLSVGLFGVELGTKATFEGSYWEEHDSNLLRGIGYMALFHSCFTGFGLKPELSLISAVGIELAGNFYEEIGLGQNAIYGIYSGPVKTDLHDFAFGTVGAIPIYLLIARIVEGNLKINFKNACK